MAKNLHITDVGQQSAMDAFAALIDGGATFGYLELYDDTGSQPADADDAVGSSVLLGTLTFSDPAFLGANASGVTTADTITGDSAADATGTALWARVYDSDATAIFDCNAGEAADVTTITLDNKNIVQNGTIDITSFTLTMPDGT